MFYTFRQNNSGGNFIIKPKKGISVNVIIEADDEQHALYRAERIGLYFDGCSTGQDCSCCGDRWSDYVEDGTAEPQIYGEPVIAGKVKSKSSFDFKWADGQPEGYIHYQDGRIEPFDI